MTNLRKFTKTSSILLAFCLLLGACGTPKNIVYMQEAEGVMTTDKSGLIRLQPYDKVSILVNVNNPELTNSLNLPYVTRQLGQTVETNLTSRVNSSYNQSQGLSAYTVDSNGDIDFPMIGKVHVVGLTRQEVAETIKAKLMTKEEIKNPIVSVEFVNMVISVLGEVNKAGRMTIDRDEITILDAIAAAGDLTITGRRENVLVTRYENGTYKAYRVDLTNAKSLFESPVFYLKQNDQIYVEPNNMRARQSTVNGNNVVSTSFWISLTSLLTSISTAIGVYVRK